MNTATQAAPPGGVNTRPLWAAIAVLGIAVVALGASLVHIQTRPADGHMALAALDPPLTRAPEAVAAGPVAPLPVTTVGAGETVLTTPAAAPTLAARTVPPLTVHKPSALVIQAPPVPVEVAPRVSAIPALPVRPAVVIGTESNAPMVRSEAGLLVSRPVAPPPRTLCATCGRVESVQAIQRKGDAQGVGAVAGGVLGAALVYQVQVRMEDGSLRVVERANAPAIGSAVFVEVQQMRPAEGGAVPVTTQRSTPAPGFVPQAKFYRSERY